MNGEPRILSVATAVPPHRVGQEEAKTFARGMFSRGHGDFERLLPIFDNVHVENRYFCVPVEWFEQDHTFPEKNALYVEHALDLSEKAARRALDRVGAGPEEVGAIFFVSTTGISTPSLDSKLIFRLGLSEHTRRVPIWGLGCSAGAAGLARASEHARLYPDQLVLLVAVELSGLTFQRGDRSKSNLISTSLFADGAAAVLLGGYHGPRGTRRLQHHLARHRGRHGLGPRRDRPARCSSPRASRTSCARSSGATWRRPALPSASTSRSCEHFVLHPGGSKSARRLRRGPRTASRRARHEPGRAARLRQHVQRHGPLHPGTLPRVGELAPGDLGVLSAMGPGFSAEHVFFRC